MTTLENDWKNFVEAEIRTLTPLLQKRTIKLKTEQPHVSGERFLMSGKKVVLLGVDTSADTNVIIKSSTDPESKKELRHEQATRTALQTIAFAYNELLTPTELWSKTDDDRLTIVTECIEQPLAFLSLPLKKQFDLLLGAFAMLEGVRATTPSHQPAVAKFGNKTVDDYLALVAKFHEQIVETNINLNEGQLHTLEEAKDKIVSHRTGIDRYCDFLTHDDFALHNFRFKNDAIYLIDQASLTFGNKHESWGRILNYMALYNPELEQAFTAHIKMNLSKEEQDSVWLLREFKLLELIAYHAHSTAESTGNVQTLSRARVDFWIKVLVAVSAHTSVPTQTIEHYKQTRDKLRSEAEIERQKVLQQLL
jgi:hypothetical protein